MKLGCFAVLVMGLGLANGWSDEPQVAPPRRSGTLFQIPAIPPLPPPDPKRPTSPTPKAHGWKLSGHVRCESPELNGQEQDLVILVDLGDPSLFVVLARGETQGSLSFRSMDEQAGCCIMHSSESNQTFKVFWATPNIKPEPRPPTCFQSAPLAGVVELYGRLQSKTMISPPRTAAGRVQYRSAETSRERVIAQLTEQLNAAGLALVPTADKFIFAVPYFLTNSLLSYDLKPVAPKTADQQDKIFPQLGDIGVNQLSRAFGALTGRSLSSKSQPEVIAIPADAKFPQLWFDRPTVITNAPTLTANRSNSLHSAGSSEPSPTTPQRSSSFGDRSEFSLSPSEKLYWIEARALLGGLTFVINGADTFRAERSPRPFESLLKYQKATLGETNLALIPTLSALKSIYADGGRRRSEVTKLAQEILMVEEANAGQPGSNLEPAIMNLVRAHDASGEVEEGDLVVSEYTSPGRLDPILYGRLCRDAAERFARQARWSLALQSFTNAPEASTAYPSGWAVERAKTTILRLHQGDQARYREARTKMLTNGLAIFPADRPLILQNSAEFEGLVELLSVALASEIDDENLAYLRHLTERIALDPAKQTNQVAGIQTTNSGTAAVRSLPRVSSRTTMVSSVLVRGLLAFRERNYSLANQELQRAAGDVEKLAEEWTPIHVQIYATRALALLRLGRTNDAVDWFSKATEWLGMASRSVQASRPPRWSNVVLAEVLYREAKAEFPGGTPRGGSYELNAPWTSWTNSLGMVFRPVPDTRVQFSIWETRVDDFDRFVESSGYRVTAIAHSWRTGNWVRSSASWRSPDFAQTPYHPVCEINWDDAQQFCKWLSSVEKRQYRLPTDEEWSRAVGLISEEKTLPVSNARDVKQGSFPWGTEPIPLLNGLPAGNYAGEELLGSEGWNATNTIAGFRDPFVRTAPVGSFPPNRFGLYDLGGNVNEWLQDNSTEDAPDHRLRGGSWLGSKMGLLSSTNRVKGRGRNATATYGFRVVLEDP